MIRLVPRGIDLDILIGLSIAIRVRQVGLT